MWARTQIWSMQHVLKVLAGRTLVTLMCQALPSLSIQNQRFSHPVYGFPNPSQHITGFHPLLWKLSRSLAETGTVIACFDDKQNQIMSALVFD